MGKSIDRLLIFAAPILDCLCWGIYCPETRVMIETYGKQVCFVDDTVLMALV